MYLIDYLLVTKFINIEECTYKQQKVDKRKAIITVYVSIISEQTGRYSLRGEDVSTSDLTGAAFYTLEELDEHKTGTGILESITHHLRPGIGFEAAWKP